MNPAEPYPPSSFIKAHLLQGPLYREDQPLWETLLQVRGEVAHYLRDVGQELVIDEAEGYAFLRQLVPADDEKIPRLAQRRRLGYEATLLLVCLRSELDRFERSPGESAALVLTREQIREFASDFLRQTADEKRDRRALDSAIDRLIELGFLRRFGGDEERCEVRRIIKARLGPEQLEEIKQRLLEHARTHTS
ncbi:MAG: DUF4194 domain-containing protein [Opitutaceae bacterium]|jgi:hypothetical protein